MKKIIAILISSVLLSGCASILFDLDSEKRISALSKGMTQAQVTEVMQVSPDFRRFDNEMEEWEYHYGATETSYRVCTVTFVDGRVIGLDTYVHHKPTIIHQGGHHH